MQEEKSTMNNLQVKSHEVLIRLLNNIGIVGVILVSIVDIIVVVIFVEGIIIDIDKKSAAIFACINATIGVVINILLRYQGKKYAEIENQELCDKFYRKRVKEKKFISIEKWMLLSSLNDIITKGCTTAFAIFGAIYISIEGSKNPIQILISLSMLILSICFGLINMNSAYGRYISIQVPYMELKVKEKGEQ